MGKSVFHVHLGTLLLHANTLYSLHFPDRNPNPNLKRMEEIKEEGGGGGRRVEDDDLGDGMQCSNHPFRNNPGGICAFCLQDKLGKLVSSSFPLPLRLSSASSTSSPPPPPPPPPLTSQNTLPLPTASVTAPTSLSLSLSIPSNLNKNATAPAPAPAPAFNINQHYFNTQNTSRTRIPFLSANKKKKIMAHAPSSSSSSSDPASNIVFKRSKSTANPTNTHFLIHSSQHSTPTPKRGGFWSFLYHSSHSTTTKRMTPNPQGPGGSNSNTRNNVIVEEDYDETTPNTTQASSFERKVSRSRSVGCGSRSFSGDFFERISTGFGDCTLRRVESQREAKSKVNASSSAIKERVKCGGIFGGFIMTSSSSSSSNSSSSTEDVNGKSGGAAAAAAAAAGQHGRNHKSWGWAFASPMRAFSKPSSKDGKKDIIRQTKSKNPTPNLAAIPSLLSVRA